jgi:hypothetical protein
MAMEIAMAQWLWRLLWHYGLKALWHYIIMALWLCYCYGTMAMVIAIVLWHSGCIALLLYG